MPYEIALVERLISTFKEMASQNSDQRLLGFFQQSQLLILRVIAMGMFYHWHQIYASQGVNSDRALINVADKLAENKDGENSASASTYPSIGTGYNRGEFNLFYPHPLEESVAKRAFSVATEYFRAWVSPHSVRMLVDTVGNQTKYQLHLRSTHTSQSVPMSMFMMDTAVGSEMLQRFVNACLNEPTTDLALEIQDAAGAIYMFVSATNWNIALQRVKSCLYLTLSRGEDVSDLTDIRFLEYATMDIARLTQVLEAFSEAFTRVKAAEQLKLVVALRRVIWGFITRCSGTYLDMHRNMYRPSSARIDQLMDSVRTVIDSHTRTSAHPAYYQLMILLLMICPDQLACAAEHVIEHGETREDSCSKHARFIGRLHQQLISRDVPESVVLGAQELQRAATVMTALPGNNAHRLSERFDADINAVLLDSSNRLSPYREEPIETKLLLMNTMACQFQLGSEKALQIFLPRVTGPKAEPWMQLAFIHAVTATLQQRYYRNGVSEDPVFNKMISKLYLDLLRRNVDTIQTISEQQAAGGTSTQGRGTSYGRRVQGVDGAGGIVPSKSVCDVALNLSSTGEKVSIIPANEIAQRVQMVATILTDIADEPRLVVWGENEDAKFESLELMVGAISSCIQEPSVAIQRKAGVALRALFSPLMLTEWIQSADIVFAVWTLSLQVIQGICRAIVHSMVTSTMAQHRQLLEIMHDMLVLSNSIVEISGGMLGASVEMAEYPQFEVAFEVVIMMHLWADDPDITQLTQECLRLKTHGQQLVADAGIPVDVSLSNNRLYQELDTNDVKQAGVYSRLAQMRAIFRTIRKHMRPTAGAQAAWQETYKLWRQMLQVLLMREESARVPEGVPVEREPSTSATIGSNASSSSREKEDKKDASRRRNVFEKLTGHGIKAGGRISGAPSGAQGAGAAAAVIAAGSVGSAVSTHDDAHSGAGVRTAGGIGVGVQLPAIARTPTLTISELRTQWRYCTGFLLAAGGACITDGQSASERISGGDAAELHALLEHFLGECLKLIVCDDIQLRELAKEGLGNKTHPGIYMLFLDGCLLNIKRFMQPTGEVNVSESRTLFVSQCVAIIESLTDRDVTDALLQSSMNIDFSPVLLIMGKYLHAAAAQTANNALQERIRFTRMIDMFLQSPLRQFVAQEVNLRNDLLETFVNWVTELRAMDPRTLRAEEPHVAKLLIDLTTSAMRALIQVLDKLVVKPMSSSAPAVAGQPNDVRSLRSRAYRRYFDFFVRFMSQCRMIEIQEFSSMTSVHAANSAASAAVGTSSASVAPGTTRSRSARSESFAAAPTDVGVGRDIARAIYGAGASSAMMAQTGANRFNRELAQNAELLLNIAIKAVTNMLAGNLEIGLQYSLTVIYHEDTKLRALFTDMFTTILNEGIDIDSLGADSPDHWKARMIESLVDPGLKLLLGINEVCQVQDIDELGAALIRIYEARQQTRNMFERIIAIELERTDSAAELFRRNCLATRLLSNYAKLHGDGYLKSTLVPAIRKLLAQPPGTLTFELNPNKMAESVDRDHNLENVERLCGLVIDAIVGSVHSLPPPLRWICNLIYRIVIKRFPDAGYTAVGGFIFLRFLCPAIVAPDAHGICGQITNPEVRRGLLLCTKITHNLANDIQFGNKETYMVPLNRFILENRTRTTNFLSEIAEPTDNESVFEGAAKSAVSSNGTGKPNTEYGASEGDTDKEQLDSTGISNRDFVAVQRFIFDHLERLEPYLSREPLVRVQQPQTSKTGDRRRSTRTVANAGTVMTSGTSGSTSAIGNAAVDNTGGNASGKANKATSKVGGEASTAAGQITTATENLFTQVSYLMRQLGPPPAAAAEQMHSKIAAVVEKSSAAAGGEEMFHEILRRDSGRSTDAIAKKAIIYIGGLSREKRPVVYVIARRMQMHYLDMDLVMLHVLRVLESLATKSFELFFDLTQFGPANEVPAQWLRQLKRIVPESIVSNVQSVYWYNVNTHFRKYTKQGGLELPARLARRSVFPHSLGDLHEFLASPQADLPPGTVSLDSDNGINVSPIARVSRAHAALPCVVKVTPEAVQITALRRQEVFGLSTYFNDVYHITEIEDVQVVPNTEFPAAHEAEAETGHKSRSALHRTGSRTSEGDRAGAGPAANGEQLVMIRFEGSGTSLAFASPKHELLVKAIRSARARYATHTTAPAVAERVIRPADVPGTLLNVALLNCGSESATLRISAYRMLISVVATFNMDVGQELAFASDLCLPPNPLQFIFRICTRLSCTAPDMTQELLAEALLAFTKSTGSTKAWILHYVQPWLRALGQFTHNSEAHPDAVARTQDIVRSLARLHLKEPAMYMHFKEHVWSLLAQVDELTDVVLDTLVTVALEYGALTVETELIADVLATAAGRNARYNKLVPRLRKLVAHTCTLSVSHIGTHQLWPEIAVYMRLLLTMSFSNTSLAEEYLADIAFVACMLLKAGPGLVQATLHGTVMHVVHSLALTQCNGAIIDSTFSSSITGANSFAGNPVRQLRDAGPAADAGAAQLLSPYAQLAQQLAELIQARTRFNFGLRAKSTSAVTFIAASYTRGGAASTLNAEALAEFRDELGSAGAAHESPREALDGVERVAQIFLRIMDNSAFAGARGNSWRARWTTLVTASTFVFNPAVQPRAFVLLGQLAAHDEVDDDLLYQTLATLRGALASLGETDEALPVSVLLCLASMVGGLPPDSSYLAALFWVAIAVMQIGHQPLYKVAIALMARVIRSLDACGAFLPENGDGFQHFLMAARAAVEPAADRVDDAVGVSFRSSFSAALSALLLRGMEDTTTKDDTYELLLLILGVVASCRRWQHADAANPARRYDLILPYLTLIMPTASVRKELPHVFSCAGIAVSADVKTAIEHGGFVRLLEQIHRVDIARGCQSDYILYPSILAAMLHKTRSEQEITILYTILASSITWVDATMSLLVMESLAPTLNSTMINSHSSKLTHIMHNVMVRLAITRPNFDPDVFIHQQSLLHNNPTTLSDISHSLTIDAIAATTRKSVSAVHTHSSAIPAVPAAAGSRVSNLPPARVREDSSDRSHLRSSTGRSQDAASMLSKQSSSPSLAHADSFDRSMVPAHKEYLTRIGFGGLGRVISFDGGMTQWREMAELASLVVDQML
ncbi:Ras GTPase activating protein ira2 [Coemansia sp. RSA 1365]|nr:Ras GTPase activating protein ira2 [Coemansia sp. RSA 1365]